MIRGSVPPGVRYFSIFQNTGTGSTTHPVSYSTGTAASVPTVNLTIRLHILPGLRIGAAVPAWLAEGHLCLSPLLCEPQISLSVT
jgi:hypothetical protein